MNPRIDINDIASEWPHRWTNEEVICPCPALDDFLTQWGLSQRNFNTESLARLELIFSSLKEEKEIRDIERKDNTFLAKERAVRGVYDELKEIGRLTGKPALIKIAESGHNLVNLSVGISDVCSQLGLLSGTASAATSAGATMPAMASLLGPIAALQPAFLIVGAGYALASLCGLGKRRHKRKNKEDLVLNAIMKGMRIIHEAVFEVHKAVIDVHGAVIEVHKAVGEVYEEVRKVGELVCSLYNYLIEDVQKPILDGIDRLDDSLQSLHIISGLEHKELYLYRLSELVNRLSRIDEVKIKDKDIANILVDLSGWFSNTSCGDMLTGRNFAKTGVIANKPEWIKQVLSNPNHNIYNLIGYLAIRADAPNIDQALLMNLTVWNEAVKNYLMGLAHVDLNDFHPDSSFDCMQEQIKNYLAFIQLASSNEDLYKNLFENYRKCIMGINQTIDDRFNELRANRPETVSGSMMEQIFPKKSGARVKLEFWLDALDDFHLLLSAYTQLGGITRLYEQAKKDLLTREKIFAYEDDFLDHTIQGPAWSDTNGFSPPEHYETIRTSVFKLNGKDVFAGIVRQSDGVTIDLYDLKTNKPLEGLPERANKNVCPKWGNENGYGPVMRTTIHNPYINNYPTAPQGWKVALQMYDVKTTVNINPNAHIYYRTIRAKVMTVQGQPKIYVMAMHTAGFQTFLFDPAINSWEKLPDAPLGIASGSEVINHDLYSVIVNGEPTLYQIVVTARGSQLTSYNPLTKIWQKVIDIPHLKTNTCYTGGYVLENNGRQYLYFLSAGEERKFRIDEYDLIKNVCSNTVIGADSLPNDHDLSTMRAQVLTAYGTQKLYFSIWTRPSNCIKVMMYDPSQNKIESVCEGPKWKGENISILRLQAIQLNGEHKLLAMVRHPKTFEKHLFDPQTATWQSLGDQPSFIDNDCFNQEKCSSTIQCHVIDTHPEHQELLISGRDINGLKMQRFKVAPLHIKALMYVPFNKFLLELKKVKNPENNAVEMLHVINAQIEMWKKFILSMKMVNTKPQPHPYPQSVAIHSNNKELQSVIKTTEFFNKKLVSMVSFIIDSDDESLFMENNKIIADAISQLKVSSVAAEGLLDTIIMAFIINDSLCETYVDNYKLSFKVEELIRLIERQIENIRKPESNIKRHIHLEKQNEALINNKSVNVHNNTTYNQRLFMPKETALKQDKMDTSMDNYVVNEVVNNSMPDAGIEERTVKSRSYKSAKK